MSRRQRAHAALLIALAAAAACDRRKAPADALRTNEQLAAKIATITPRIEELVGLRFKTPPRAEIHSKSDVRAVIERQFNESAAARDLSGQEAAYKRLGLIPDTLDMRKYFVELLTEQVIGLYDPKTKTLYVVGDLPTEVVGLTTAHELVHALQDQYFNLDSIQRVERDNDRAEAAAAVIEGQATYVHTAYTVGTANVAARLPGGWDRIRQEIRNRQSQMPLFSSAPLIVQETLLFPYVSGLEFMSRFSSARAGKQPLADPPRSTEQIIAPDRYFVTRDTPTTIVLPPLRGGAATYENGLGEFETRLLLYEYLADQGTSMRGAAGWDGDRYAVMRTGGGEGIVWVSVWDTAVDAGEFYDAMDEGIKKRFKIASVGEHTGARTYAAGARSLTLSTVEVQGRPVVVYVDVPRGASTDVLDVRAIRLSQ